jgi:hypothetical protein
VSVILLLLGLLASPARAAFHLAVIDEIMLGLPGNRAAQYVEIRMLQGAQTQLTNSVLSFFSCNGMVVATALVLDHNVTNQGPGVRWSMATDEFRIATGITPDFTFPAILNADPMVYESCGMICWGAPGLVPPSDPNSWSHSDRNNYVDCVGFGPYSGLTKTSTHDGTPTSGTPTTLSPNNGTQSLTRVSATGDNLADFVLAAPTPTNNSAPLATTTTTTLGPGGTTTTTPGGPTVTTTTFPPGVGQTVSGTQLLLKTGARPAKKSLLAVGKDTSIVLGDPRQVGGSLHVFTTAGDAFDAIYPLPAARWKPIGKASAPKGWRFKDPAGPIKLVIVKQAKLVKTVGKGAALTLSLASDPRPVGVVLAVGTERYCMSFGGSVVFKPAKRFLATGATPPAACP